jgi:hypothetical protein
MLLVHRRDIIEPIEITDRLHIGLMFDQFFSAAVEQPNMRIDALDNLAVEFQDEAQNAMRRRVLRPKIYGEVPAWSIGHSGFVCCTVNTTSVARFRPFHQQWSWVAILASSAAFSAANNSRKPIRNVPYSPKSGHRRTVTQCPLCAKRRHLRRIKTSQIHRIHPNMPAATMMGIGLTWDFQKRIVHAAVTT